MGLPEVSLGLPMVSSGLGHLTEAHEPVAEVTVETRYPVSLQPEFHGHGHGLSVRGRGPHSASRMERRQGE